MPKYRNALPQLSGDFFLTDGGIETTLIFLEGQELPQFAAFPLLASEEGTAALRKYFRTYAQLAERFQTGLVLETPTWRANPDWATKLGYGAAALAVANRRSVLLLEQVRTEFESTASPIVISGCIGPRGDGYVPNTVMTGCEAEKYHCTQIDTFADSNADLVTALTMNYAAEAIGVVRAAQAAGMPVVISFTVETDGRLPDGQALQEVIRGVDKETGSYPSYYMLNCAHPDHFAGVLSAGETWTARIRGLRANASRKSHQELNEATDLDIGDPDELGRLYAGLRKGKHPGLNVCGGCCGTDHRHIERIAAHCLGS